MIHSLLTVQIGFATLTVVYLLWLVALFNAAAKSAGYDRRKRLRFIGSIGVAVLAWLTFSGIAAYHGFFSDFSAMPPKFVILILVPLLSILWFTSRRNVTELIRMIPPGRILYMQSFRVVVEILLWMLFVQNLIPEQMTFEGRNWDILVGLTGPVIGYLYSRNKVAPGTIRIWNIAGLLLLLNIVTIAILSTPIPFRVFMNEPANTIVTTFPIVWLPAFLVPLAYTLHIISWKQVSQKEQLHAV